MTITCVCYVKLFVLVIKMQVMNTLWYPRNLSIFDNIVSFSSAHGKFF